MDRNIGIKSLKGTYLPSPNFSKNFSLGYFDYFGKLSDFPEVPEEEGRKQIDRRIINQLYAIVQEVEKIIIKEERYLNMIIGKDILAEWQDQNEVIMLIMDLLVLKAVSMK